MELFTCPECSRNLSRQQVELMRPFRCPHCRTPLEVPSLYTRAVGLPCLAIATAVMYGLGARGMPMLLLGLIANVPLRVFALEIVAALFPPHFVRSQRGMTKLRDYEPKDE
jgi:hypothetical protein